MSMFGKKEQENPRPFGAPQGPPVHAANLPQPAGAPQPPKPAPMPAASSVTSIGRSVSIKGEIRAQEDLVIDGQIEGRLDLGQNRLVVGPNATVRAEIAAREVDLHGVINGNVVATDRVILRNNSKLVGDLKMASIVIEDGAYFKGSIDITRPQDTKSATATKPSVA